MIRTASPRTYRQLLILVQFGTRVVVVFKEHSGKAAGGMGSKAQRPEEPSHVAGLASAAADRFVLSLPVTGRPRDIAAREKARATERGEASGETHTEIQSRP